MRGIIWQTIHIRLCREQFDSFPVSPSLHAPEKSLPAAFAVEEFNDSISRLAAGLLTELYATIDAQGANDPTARLTGINGGEKPFDAPEE